MNQTSTAKRPAEAFEISVGQDDQGQPIFAVLLKRTYDIRANQAAVRAEQDNPLVQTDVYYDDGDPRHATVKYESDMVPYKLATDVVVVGKAHSSTGKPATQLDAAVEIGGIRKVIRVIGDRKCIYRKNRLPGFTDPVPFVDMEIRYERAYGGWDRLSDPEVPFVYPRNHMGTGVAITNTPETIEGLVLPNLEDPDDLLTPDRLVLEVPNRWNGQPIPQGLGWFQKVWYPRCSFVGAIPGYVDPDEVLREETMGLVPQNQIALARQFKLPSFDARFNSGASPGLAVPYLKGGEQVKLIRLTPEEQLAFTLPVDPPRIMLNIGQGANEMEPVLHSVCVYPEEMKLDLVWRGAQQYPGMDWLPEMKIMDVEVT
jgi:hypothetical protein